MGLCSNKQRCESSSNHLVITASICDFEKSDLFDFKRKAIVLNKIVLSDLTEDHIIKGDGSEISHISLKCASSSDINNSFMTISQSKGCFVFKKAKVDDSKDQDPINMDNGFLIAIQDMNDLDSKGAKLSQGDLIVLGKRMIRIRALDFNNTEDDIYEIMRESTNALPDMKSKDESHITCRICLVEEIDGIENPLLSPCLCSGSVRHVHLMCLRKSIERKKFSSRKSLFAVSFNLKVLVCEICKSTFPETIEHNNRFYSMIDKSRINPPFLIFEVLNSSRTKVSSIHCLKLNFNIEVSIGSSPNVDIRIRDSSISGHHANLVINSSGIFICDIDSRFGTYKFLKQLKAHEKLNNFRLKFGKLILKASVSCPGKPSLKDLPDNVKHKIRFSDYVAKKAFSSDRPENLLDIEPSSDEENENDSTGSLSSAEAESNLSHDDRYSSSNSI